MSRYCEILEAIVMSAIDNKMYGETQFDLYFVALARRPSLERSATLRRTLLPLPLVYFNFESRTSTPSYESGMQS